MSIGRALFRGRCRGGPWDGKDLQHHLPWYDLPMLPPISFRKASEPPDPPTNITLKWGTYRHVAEQWIWREDDDTTR